MSLVKRQHYVPRVYLNAWADKKGLVNVVDKRTKNTFTSSVEKICLENNYYESPGLPPTNELEKKFGRFEYDFGKARDFLSFVASNAKSSGHPVSETLADALTESPHHQATLKNFAGTSYVRTPGALASLRKELAADKSPTAQMALEQLDSPYQMNALAFESTLLERFSKLHIALMYSETRLATSDWPCFPVFGGLDHKNFTYDIGRHEEAAALMTLTPNIVLMFLPNIANQPTTVLPGRMPKSLAEQTNKIIYESAERWFIQ